jgi:hypothetical protein
VTAAASEVRFHPHASEPREERTAHIFAHLSWLFAGATLGFFIPYVFTTVLDVHHDLYYLIFFSGTLAFLAAYIASMSIDVVQLFRRNWRWSVGIGVAGSAFLVANVLSRDATNGPTGVYAGFEVIWRGLAYGVVDTLLLTAFPCVVALALLKGDLRGLRRKVSYAVIALPMVIFITGIYHLGYQQFREDGIGGPEIGNVIISVPMLLTANPAGSIVAHASMHITADIHSYETDVFLPPQTEAPK